MKLLVMQFFPFTRHLIFIYLYMKIYSYGYDSMKVVSQLAQAVTCLPLTRD
jgi:hypothetical protein